MLRVNSDHLVRRRGACGVTSLLVGVILETHYPIPSLDAEAATEMFFLKKRKEKKEGGVVCLGGAVMVFWQWAAGSGVTDVGVGGLS